MALLERIIALLERIITLLERIITLLERIITLLERIILNSENVNKRGLIYFRNYTKFFAAICTVKTLRYSDPTVNMFRHCYGIRYHDPMVPMSRHC